MPVIKGLLDDLWQKKVLSTEDKDSVTENQTSKVDRARCLIDMVMGKGERASQKMVDSMKVRDMELCISLGLIPSPSPLPGMGAGDIWRAHSDMKEANLKGSEDYYQARGNHEAAQRGPGGKWMAEVISDAREKVQGKRGRGRRDHDNTNQGGAGRRGIKDSAADQEANRWGRNGGDPNVYRPKGLPSKY
ncbi:hypothetical protein NHX12_004072 [Muraenolepis orangiensis]|uniref:Serum amyloid A protein n=1 Tax=Muraenolepis orangiensis TaxID=630683 RepID=A0A9Q0DTR2_9TELE|nr:hypothetical protein NHX12_004072 [Muraenolepis orangiensis]